MENLNDVLMDESNNDKLLIKELSKVVKDNRDKEKPIDKKFIKKVVETIQDSDPDLALNDILFFEDTDGTLGQCGSKELTLYPTEINRTYNYKKYQYIQGIGDKRLLAYYTILHTLVHEFTHCKQEKLSNEKKQRYYELSYALIALSYEEYSLNYEFVPIERYAELRSDKITNTALSYIYDEKKLKPFRDHELLNLIRGYYVNEDGEIYSPLFRFEYLASYDKLKASELDLSKYKDLYNRMYLGMKIEPEEYNKIVELIINKEHHNEKTHKLVNNIK